MTSGKLESDMVADFAARLKACFGLALLLASILTPSGAMAEEAGLPTFRPTVLAIYETTPPGLFRRATTPAPQSLRVEVSDEKMPSGTKQAVELIGTSLYENDKDGAPIGPVPAVCISDAVIADPATCTTKAATVGRDISSMYLVYGNMPVAAGAYAGELRFSAPDNRRFALPFTLSVKHGLSVPLVVIVLGCIISVVLNLYTTQQRRLDELQLELDRILRVAHEWQVEDPEFREAVRLAQNAIEARSADVAQSKVEAARARMIEVGRTAGGAVRTARARSVPPVLGTARQRRIAFWTWSYGIALLLLVITGLNTLYLDNPTFGAGRFDYLGLFLWGFGSQATADSIGRLTSSWNLPGLNRQTA
jgi:hypothetical protein